MLKKKDLLVCFSPQALRFLPTLPVFIKPSWMLTKEKRENILQEITKRAVELWFKIKNDKNEVQRYIELSSSNRLSSLYLIIEPHYIVTK